MKDSLLSSDVIFKSVFMHNEDILNKFIYDITGERLESIHFYMNEIPIRRGNEKFKRCDFIIHTDKKGNKRDLGCGAFSFKASISKKQVVVHKIAIEPYKTSDYEIIPHHFDEAANAAEIQRFMDKYIFKPYVLGKNIVGVELNFNKEFYVPEKQEFVEDIMAEIHNLDDELAEIVL